jgi:ATP-dependent DNA helicase RecG
LPEKLTLSGWRTCYRETYYKGALNNVSDKVVEKLSANQLSILNLISNNQHITATEMAKAIGISHRKIQENIANLKEMGLLKRIGPAKGGHWVINEK